MGNAKASSGKILIRNRKATHEFLILERFEAGLVLLGTEVKSLREGNASLDESYLRFEGAELYWVKGHIQEFRHGGKFLNHETRRKRKVLLRKSQLRKLKAAVHAKGSTVIPLDIHLTERGYLKMSIGLGRGKKTADKRQAEKKKQARREMRDY